MTAQTTPLNRAERRALKHKRGPSKPGWHSGKVIDTTPIALLDDCRPFRAGETTDSHLITRAAFERLMDATATEADFDRIAMAMNIAKYRAMEIDEGLAIFFEQAQDAMDTCKQRYLKLGEFGFDEASLQTMRQALDHHETITDASSPQQLEIARKLAIKTIQKQVLRNAHQPTPQPA